MMRRAWLIGSVGAMAAAAGAGWAWWRRPVGDDAKASPPDRVWSLQFERPEGGMLEMARFRGRPLLLNFWATWCPPCVEEMPLLDTFHRNQPPQGWQVVGLAVDRIKPVQDFLAKRPMGFATGLAGMDGLNLARELGNTGGALPFTIAFDREARLWKTHLGPLKASDLEGWRSSMA